MFQISLPGGILGIGERGQFLQGFELSPRRPPGFQKGFSTLEFLDRDVCFGRIFPESRRGEGFFESFYPDFR